MDKQRRKLLQNTAILDIVGLSWALWIARLRFEPKQNAAKDLGAKGAAAGASGTDFQPKPNRQCTIQKASQITKNPITTKA